MSRQVVALCDEDLIGKTLQEGEFEIKVSERFYKGEIVSEGDALKVLKGAINVNIIGKKSINVALKAGIITKANILMIRGVPYANASA